MFNNDEWITSRLEDLVSGITSGGTPESGNAMYYTNNGISFAKIDDLTKCSDRYLTQTEQQITPLALKKTNVKVFPKGTIVVSMYGTIGLVRILGKPIATNQAIAALLAPYNLESTLLVHLLEFNRAKLVRSASQTTQANISATVLKSFVLKVPKQKSEQRRIAEILDTLDETIRKTEALIGKLKQVKAGLLHDLLTRGIDEQGQLRNPATHPEQFKDSPLGRIPREWRVGQIKDLATNLDGKRVPLKQDEREKMKGEIPYYGASGIIDNIDSYLFEGEFVLLGEDGENVVSRNLPLAFRVEGKIWVNNHAHVFKPHKTTNSWFLAELLESVDYTPYVSGSAQPKLTQAALDHLLLPIPPIGEQTSIANVIKSHSTRIQKEQSYLNKLQQLKKGLMEDLLTGKVRVNELEEVQA